MSDLLFTLNAVAPIMLMVAIGYFLGRIGIITDGGAREMNKLVFRLFLPVMLFLNIYKIDNLKDIELGYVIYVVIAVLLIFSLSFWIVRFISDDNGKRGAIMQATFRSNYALIGIPLATAVFGEAGGSVATLLSLVTIPLFNILAVVALTVFGEDDGKAKINFKKIFVGIAKNPLIISILMGCVALFIRAAFVKLGVSFRLSDLGPVYKTLSQLSDVATPLALVVLGAGFKFKSISGMKKEIMAGVILRCVVVPLIGIGVALLLGIFEPVHFAAFIAVFGTATAVSTVPMADAMKSDVQLTSQLVVWTTVMSAFTLFVFIYFLRIIDIF